MKQPSIAVLFVALVGCKSVTADILRPADANGLSTISVKNTLVQKRVKNCAGDDRRYSNTVQGDQLGVVGATLIGAAISAGVDFVGNRLQSAGEEQTRMVTAIHNTDGVPKVGCLEFERFGADSSTDSRFTIYLKPSTNGVGIIPYLADFEYKKTIDGKDEGVRGLAISLSATRATSNTASTRTISLGNVEVGAKHYWSDPTSSPFFSGYMANPYISKLAKPVDGKEYDDVPAVTWSLTVTEVRNANALVGAIGEGLSGAKDDISSELIGLITNDGDDEPATIPPPVPMPECDCP